MPTAAHSSSAQILSSRAANDAGRPPVTGRPRIGSSVLMNGGVDQMPRRSGSNASIRATTSAGRSRTSGSRARSSAVTEVVSGGGHVDDLDVRHLAGTPGGREHQDRPGPGLLEHPDGVEEPGEHAGTHQHRPTGVQAAEVRPQRLAVGVAGQVHGTTLRATPPARTPISTKCTEAGAPGPWSGPTVRP